MEYKGNGFRFAPHVKEKFEFSTKNFEIQANRLGGIFDTEKSKHQAGSVWDTEGLSPTLDTMQGGWRQPCIIDATKLLKVPQATKSGYIDMELPGVADLSYPSSKTRRCRVQEGGKISPCIAATQQDICYIENNNDITLDMDILSQLRIRKLTPKECWRLMSFADSDIEKCISIGISNTQLYKQAGNSIVVNVLEAILGNLLK
jgi:DNA (cytosine-5)-methyltransferase 1